MGGSAGQPPTSEIDILGDRAGNPLRDSGHLHLHPATAASREAATSAQEAMEALDHLFDRHDVREPPRYQKREETLSRCRGIVASVIALVFRIQLLTTSDTTYTQSALFICV